MSQGVQHSRWGRVPYARLAGPLIDQIPAAIAIFDADLCCVMVNAQWSRQFPGPLQDPVGCSCDELISTGCPLLRGYLERGLQGEAFCSDPANFVSPDAKVTWYRSHVAPWCDARGKIRGVMLVCEDITPEIELKFRNKLLTEEIALFDNNAEGFALCLMDKAGRVTIWNRGAERLTGWSEAEVLGAGYDFLFDAEDRAAGVPQRHLSAARRQGTFRDRGWRMRKGAKRFRADVIVSWIEGDNLLPSGFGLILRDVTSEERQARWFEANAVLLGSILQTLPDALIVIDIEGRILMFSQGAEAMYGYQASEVVGKDCMILVPERGREASARVMEDYRMTGDAGLIGRKHRLVGRRKDGSEFPHSVQFAEAFGGGQRMIAVFVHDLAEEEARQAEFEELQRELAHISRVYEMGTLASTIAHELNQPLMAISNVVQTAADLLQNKAQRDEPSLIAALADAGQETLRAGEILRRLRGFLSRGELEKTLEDPCKLARDAVYFAAVRARFRNISCEVKCPPLTRRVLVDRVQIQQVILNLVKNAIQSVDKDGAVMVHIEHEPEAVRFTVTDTGPGVPTDRIERLFKPFSTTKSDGMGLGLPICRSIVEAHGGEIWYEPSGDGGAAFIFTLPTAIRESENV